ncbi:hypothetical protein [Kaistia terrae]|uniref:Uncharacterized protein n=1 Tax=Kaistia terrae TaxID=537017 RepID=A0ABW0Q320_9HYPH|nr:hypothetical protein [Kaistia terrae]MCX5578987.1 hypothetical protein [Kaistia terrae]
MANAITPYGNANCYAFSYPEAIEKSSGLSGMTMPIRDFFEMVAKDTEKHDPKMASFYREVASHYSHCDQKAHSVDRDGNGAILVDYDDWDELTDEQRLLRGNRNAAIAVLDRLRFHLEMLDDNPENKEPVDDIRRTLAELIEPLPFS